MPARLSLVLLLLYASPPASGDDRDAFLAEALAKPILPPNLTQAQVRAYAEARFPRTPAAEDARSWDRQASKIRARILSEVVFRGDAARWRDTPGRVEWAGEIEGGPGYRIKKLRYEAVPGFWIPALLYEPLGLVGKVPAVINFDGHDPQGMFADYKQIRCINLAKRGMLALNVDWIGMGQLRSDENQHGLLNHLDIRGTSGVSVFYLLMTRGVDVLLAHPHADPARVAATGLSGGGWQTIFLGALDTRVKLIAPVAGYSSFPTRAAFGSDLGDSEQTPSDLATIADYSTLTAMLAPRPALLTFNAKDNCCFAADHALPPLLAAAQPVYRLLGSPSALRTHINLDPGTHNYFRDNREAFYQMLGTHFHGDDVEYPREEIPSDAEVKPRETLSVPLPAENLTLHRLAVALDERLDRPPAISRRDLPARRARLAELIHARRYELDAEPGAVIERSGIVARSWSLRVATTWTIPAVELTPSRATGTTLLISDSGRAQASGTAARLLATNQRVIALDPIFFGEARLAEKEWLWCLVLATIGDRPLGLEASQLAATARWGARSGGSRVSIVADGRRASLAALIALTLEPDAVSAVELKGLPSSLKTLLTPRLTYEKAPDLFSFGLLREFDIPSLIEFNPAGSVRRIAEGPEPSTNP